MISRETLLSLLKTDMWDAVSSVLTTTKSLLTESLDPTVQSEMESVLAAASMLEAMIADVREFEYLNQHGLVLEDEPFDLPETLHAVSRRFEQACRHTDLSYELELDDNLPLCVSGDARRLVQILETLFTMAVRRSDEGTVRILAKRVNGDKQQATIEIQLRYEPRNPSKDTPAHIPMAVVQTGVDGCMLGLALCQLIATHMQGHIRLNSHPSGSFRYTLNVQLPLYHI